MNKRRVLELRVTAQRLKPTIHIGKDGVDENVVEELSRQLKKAKLVKIRVLNSFGGDRKGIAKQLADMTSSELIDVRGSTIVLARDEDGQR